MALLLSAVSRAQDPLLLWSDYIGSLCRADLDGTHVSTLATSVAGGLAVDSDTGIVYYASSSGTIRRVNLDGSNNQLLCATGSLIVWNMALYGGRLFFNSSGNSGATGVGRVNLDGSGLVRIGDNVRGEGLSIDQDTGIVYYQIFNSGYPIRRVNADGSGSPDNLPVQPPSYFTPGLFVDTATDRLFFVRSTGVWRSNLDGSNFQLVTAALPDYEYSVFVDSENNTIFWGSRSSGAIGRMDLDGSNRQTLLSSSAAFYALTVYRPNSEPPEPDDVVDLYRAVLHSVDKDTFIDTCRARDRDEARAAFEARHPDATIGGITYVRDAAAGGYRLFLGGVRTPEKKNLRDTCWAQNPAQARLIIGQRFPGCEVNHMGLYPQNRTPLTYTGVTQRADLVDSLAAASLRDAFAAFACRFPRELIASVVQTSHENAFATYEAVLDPEDITALVQAGSAAQAATLALALHSGCRVLSVTRHRADDGVHTYEARVHTAKGRSLRDTCSARSPAEAQKLLQDRHGAGSRVTVDEPAWDDDGELYVGGISAAGEASFVDATFAKTAAAAHEILRGRYPEASLGSVTVVADLTDYGEFQGSLSTADGRNVRDTCWATSPAAARKVFLARFPTAEVRSVSRYGAHRPGEFDVVLRGEAGRQRCEARDKGEAYRIFSDRYPKTRIVTLRAIEEVPEQRVFRAVLNTADHRTIEDTVAAKTASEARQALLARHPGSRFTSFQQMTAGRVDEVYEARIDLPPAKDTCQAYSPGEARQIFLARYPRGGTGALRAILQPEP